MTAAAQSPRVYRDLTASRIAAAAAELLPSAPVCPFAQELEAIASYVERGEHHRLAAIIYEFMYDAEMPTPAHLDPRGFSIARQVLEGCGESPPPRGGRDRAGDAFPLLVTQGGSRDAAVLRAYVALVRSLAERERWSLVCVVSLAYTAWSSGDGYDLAAVLEAELGPEIAA